MLLHDRAIIERLLDPDPRDESSSRRSSIHVSKSVHRVSMFDSVAVSKYPPPVVSVPSIRATSVSSRRTPTLSRLAIGRTFTYIRASSSWRPLWNTSGFPVIWPVELKVAVRGDDWAFWSTQLRDSSIQGSPVTSLSSSAMWGGFR